MKVGYVLFKDALNTFYSRLYGVGFAYINVWICVHARVCVCICMCACMIGGEMDVRNDGMVK